MTNFDLVHPAVGAIKFNFRICTLSAAAILSLTFVTPVFAQAAIQEPGMYAFYYPNNDVLNGGRPTPAAGLDARTLMRLNRRAAGFSN
jgi:hypothetical protein